MMQNPQNKYTSPGNFTATLAVDDGLASATGTVLINVLPALSLLAIAGTSNTVAVSWPAWASNCSLYLATNLSPPVIWWPMTNMLVMDGTNWRAQIPLGDGQQFFQLRMP